ncbi:hypothetical protein CHLRE_13g564812v5 [Chlamydomonas reinhardtii]|uniref:Uncharacterized protein n=1 Tax=Chlamydomonas reinhardtii TaxID=3055 RepID=A0A2K3CZ58_CHLRE|nr:uncharacterized protein CHLRE_13g564812v5 [Chlamydomonas reinhardtii]XP_042917218.1 uncharacterized protein CHLRE_13g564812v5 [Chlamydomonas reinhardtii]PNW73580.1 hypothetical protein CHLRE_13g564812v5 [Chlamydomonas reinhardtii]PNW73582.1 hypothetical protein CHLRE_13g564812v5 [Chlamydomonas reinhardtii]
MAALMQPSPPAAAGTTAAPVAAAQQDTAAAAQQDTVAACTATSVGLITTFPWAPALPPPSPYASSASGTGTPAARTGAASLAAAAAAAAALRGNSGGSNTAAGEGSTPLTFPEEQQHSGAGPDPEAVGDTRTGGVEGALAILNNTSSRRGGVQSLDGFVSANRTATAAAAEAAAAWRDEVAARKYWVVLSVLASIAAVGMAVVAIALGSRLWRRWPKARVAVDQPPPGPAAVLTNQTATAGHAPATAAPVSTADVAARVGIAPVHAGGGAAVEGDAPATATVRSSTSSGEGVLVSTHAAAPASGARGGCGPPSTGGGYPKRLHASMPLF